MGIPEEQSSALISIIRQLSEEMQPHKRGVIELTLESSLEKELGIDSLGRVELLLRIEQHFNLRLPEQLLASAETPGDLLLAINAAGPPRAAVMVPDVKNAPPGKVEAVPEDARTLLDVLEWHARSHPDSPHIYLCGEGDGEEVITYGALKSGALAVSTGLRKHDLQPGQAVAIMLPTGRDYFYTFLGILMAGGIPVPLYPPVRLSQIEDHLRRHAAILENSLAALLITIPEARTVAKVLKAQVEGLRRIVTVQELSADSGDQSMATVKAEDTAFLQYTSGTTGTPKGVILTHANLLANIRAMGKAVEATSRDIFVSWLPLYHDMGLIGAWLGSLYYGMQLVLMSPLTFLARPERWLWAIHKYRGTISGGPNFGYELCLRKVKDDAIEGLDLSSWRMAFNGAEPVSPETTLLFPERFGKYGFKAEAFSPVYGLAESSVGLAFPPLNRGAVIDRVKREPLMRYGRAIPADEDGQRELSFVACGQPLTGHEIRIVDAAGRELGEREVGSLQFRGPSVTGGYFRNPDESSRLFRGEWLNSGDLAYMVGGDVHLTGRSKDVIIRAGRNIYPHELEEAAGNIDGIRKGCVAAFGSTDPVSGTERFVVVAETRETGYKRLDELRSAINGVAIDLIGTPPEEVLLAPPHSLLKTSSGKIRRAASRELYERGEIGWRQRSVWWQFVRLRWSGLASRLRRVRSVGAALLYASYAWPLFLILATVTWSLAAIVPDTNWCRALSRRMSRLVVMLTGTPFSVIGVEKIPEERPCVVVVNHASYLDSIIIVAALPVHFAYVAKGELKGRPIPRLFLKRVGAEYVERFDMERGPDDVKRVSERVREGQALVFFPEGTFSRIPGLRLFYLGAFVTAAETGVPIVPVAIRGTRSMLRSESWFPRKGSVTVTIGDPIMPSGSDWAAAIRLRDSAREKILRHCGEPDLTKR